MIVGRVLDDSPEVDFSLMAVERAFSQAKPGVFNEKQTYLKSGRILALISGLTIASRKLMSVDYSTITFLWRYSNELPN
jgi:hypothetical protein